jgi:hypothetical protein
MHTTIPGKTDLLKLRGRFRTTHSPARSLRVIGWMLGFSFPIATLWYVALALGVSHLTIAH